MVRHGRSVGHERRQRNGGGRRADGDDLLLPARLDVLYEGFADLQWAGNVGMDEVIQQPVIQGAEYLVDIGVGLVQRIGSHQACVVKQDIDGHPLQFCTECFDLLVVCHIHAFDANLGIFFCQLCQRIRGGGASMGGDNGPAFRCIFLGEFQADTRIRSGYQDGVRRRRQRYGCQDTGGSDGK